MNRHRQYDVDGNLVAEQIEEVDVTADVVTIDLHAKLRAQLAAMRSNLGTRRDERTAMVADRDEVVALISEASTNRDTATAVLDTAIAARDAATPGTPEHAAAVDAVGSARASKAVAVETLKLLQRERRHLADSLRIEADLADTMRAVRMLTRIVIGSDLLADTED